MNAKCVGCGAVFPVTKIGKLAGRKWCSGSCQDKNGSFAEKRIQYMRDWRKRKAS